MMNMIFNQYLKELDEYFKRKGHKIVFFMDNVPVHIVDEATNLMNVELHYFHQIWPQFSSPLMLASFEV